MVNSQTLKDGRVVFRDSKGRFMRIRDEEAREILARPLRKIVTFRERIRGTRVARIVKKRYDMETSEEKIRDDLDSRYDRGFNYVVSIVSIRVGKMEPEEAQVEVLGPNSGDSS